MNEKDDKKIVTDPETGEVIVEEKENNEIKTIHDSVLKRNALQNFFSSNKKRARIGSAFVYEIVGDQEVFDGVYPLLRGGRKELGGDYTVIDYKGKMKYLSNPDPSDYTPTYNKIKKILHVVKMADDDFRIKRRLTDEYYKDVYIPKMEEVPVLDENDKEIGFEEKQATDEKTGELLYDIEKEYYSRPAAITQEGREAIKEGNEYEKKMAEFRKKNESFFQKNIFAIMSYGVIIIMVIGFMITANKIVDEFSEIRNQIYDDNKQTREYISNGLIDGLAQKVTEKQVEGNNPPS